MLELLSGTNVSYNIGKMKNKYLILEIFAYAYDLKKSGPMMFGTNRMLRVLMIRNLKAFSRIIRKKRIFDDFALEKFGVINKTADTIKKECNIPLDTFF